ncbi:DUF6077 domain-containing protein [Cellulomonas sp.]|uniref:DUF6077 domain-containing protein n=1 Tax=Cellulomonas sp. TaxID=40001 RepID=UPI0025B9BAA2|nr:DUF6077 domain-containing protein [Cellulomonas sp.]
MTGAPTLTPVETARPRPDRVGRFVDGCLDVAVAALGLWTLLYWGVLAGLTLTAALVGWTIGVVGVAVRRARHSWTRDLPEGGAVRSRVVAGLAGAVALFASAISRPDGDDASFVVRSTWIAEHGALPDGDFVFGEPGWPATFGSVPNVSSIEALLGALARATGLPAGDVVYRYAVPLAAFAAVWALWVLLRAWGARRPVASLVLALVFLMLGGYAHATWGNLFVARIWQGKVMLLAVLVPYLYAYVAVLWRRHGPLPRGDLSRAAAVLATVGLAAVGCSSTAVFLVPLVAAATSVALLLARRWRDAVVVVLSASVGPFAAGLMTVLSPVGARNEGGRAGEWLWFRVLGDAPPVWALVSVAAVLVLAGVLWPRWLAALERPAQVGVATAVAVGLLCTVPPLYPILTALTGGDAIAYRIAWVVPVPALVGVVASLPARRWAAPAAPAVALALVAILAVGQPLWGRSNGAGLGRPGTWKVREQVDLAAARWIVEQAPRGRYLAANWVAMMTGVLTSELRPVGTRMDYVRSLDQVPGSQVEERVFLQSLADGDTSLRVPGNLERTRAALDALDVSVACVAWSDAFTAEVFLEWGPGFADGPWTCWSR